MTIVACRQCGNAFTAELARGGLLDDPGEGPTVRRGTFAVDPAPRTVRFWQRGMPSGTTEERETDPARSIVVHPDDRLAGALNDIPGRSAGCCGLDGCGGPNQRCFACDQVVATARTDCWTEKEVRFLPGAVVLR